MKELASRMQRPKGARRASFAVLMGGAAIAGGLFTARPAYASFLDPASLQVAATTGQVTLGAQACPSADDRNHDPSGWAFLVQNDEHSGDDCGEYPHGSLCDTGDGLTAWPVAVISSEAAKSSLPGFTSTVQLGPLENVGSLVGGTIPVELGNSGTLPIRTLELQAFDTDPANLDVTVSAGGRDVVRSEPLSTLVSHPVSLLDSGEALDVHKQDLVVISLTRHRGRPSEVVARQDRSTPSLTFEVTGSDQ